MTFKFPLQGVHFDGQKIIIDHMKEMDFAYMFQLIKKEAREGKGFTEDEREITDKEEFQSSFGSGDKFVFKDATSEKAIAWLTIAPSAICRTEKIIDPTLVIADSERGKKLPIFCGWFIRDYCSWKGYDGILLDAFAGHDVVMRIFINFGCKRVGYLDVSGKDKNNDYVRCEFYFYDLKDEGRPVESSFTRDGVYQPVSQAPSKL